MPNIFREASELLKGKKGSEMSDEELNLVSRAIFPLLILRAFNDVPIGEGLEALARLLESNDEETTSAQAKHPDRDTERVASTQRLLVAKTG